MVGNTSAALERVASARLVWIIEKRRGRRSRQRYRSCLFSSDSAPHRSAPGKDIKKIEVFLPNEGWRVNCLIELKVKENEQNTGGETTTVIGAEILPLKQGFCEKANRHSWKGDHWEGIRIVLARTNSRDASLTEHRPTTNFIHTKDYSRCTERSGTRVYP